MQWKYEFNTNFLPRSRWVFSIFFLDFIAHLIDENVLYTWMVCYEYVSGKKTGVFCHSIKVFRTDDAARNTVHTRSEIRLLQIIDCNGLCGIVFSFVYRVHVCSPKTMSLCRIARHTFIRNESTYRPPRVGRFSQRDIFFFLLRVKNVDLLVWLFFYPPSTPRLQIPSQIFLYDPNLIVSMTGSWERLPILASNLSDDPTKV